MRVRKIKVEINGETFSFSNYIVTEESKFYKISFQKGKKFYTRVKKGSLCSNGYSRITIYGRSGKKLCRVRVHRVMARTFLGPCPEEKEVNHKDGNKLNDHYENLEYVTRSENTKHAYDNGLHVSPMKGKHGREVGGAKLYDRQVLKIRKLWETEKYTQVKLAEMFNLRSSGTIRSIVRGETWTHLL